MDDFFITIGRKDDVDCKLSDAAILTSALLAARYFHGNLSSACAYMQQQQGVRMIDKSGFIRRLHKLQDQLLALFLALSQAIKQVNTSCQYLIDSFPVAVCDNRRLRRCRLLPDERYRGKNASKRRYYYGFKVQVITPADGLPVQFYIHAASFADITALQAMSVDLPQQSERYGDSAYTS